MQNLYRLLGIANFAGKEEITAAYKKKYAELFSSDSPLANISKLKELKDAFDLLIDEYKREEYDEKLSEFLEQIEEKFDEAVDDLERGDFLRAIEKLKWCISQDPNTPDFYETIGLAYRLIGDLDNALNSFKQGLQTGQKSAFFYRNIGEIYRLKHDNDSADTYFLEAAEQFKKILQTDPKNIEAMEQLADIYARMQWFEESIDIYKRLIKRFPYNAAYRRNLGSVLYEVDMLEEAEAQLLEALRIKPGDSAALLFLGLVYFKRRLLAMAVETLKDSLKANPNQPEVKRLIDQIENIRSEIGQTVEEIIYDPTPDAFVEGHLKWYNPESGMGVLSCEEYPEVLLHYSALNPDQEKHLVKGVPVRFGIVKDKMSPIAVQVEILAEHSFSDVLPGKIERFDLEKKVGIIRSYDGKEVFFAFSALTKEVLAALAEGLDVLYETRSIIGLEDHPIEQAVRIRLRKKNSS